jgi:hypothetical protein
MSYTVASEASNRIFCALMKMGIPDPIAMVLAGRIATVGMVVLGGMAWSCGARAPYEGGGGLGFVGGGGGEETLDGGNSRGSSGSSGLSSGSSSGGASSSGQHSGSNGGTGQSGGESGANGGTGSSGASGGSGTGATGASSGTGTAPEDAGTGSGIHLTFSGSIHLTSLQWTISGPNMYQGSVDFGAASSFEWVIGGILDGSGYTLSVVASDAAGDPCQGTSAPFNVEASKVNYIQITVVCDVRNDMADVSTGSLAVEAGVVAN